MPVLEMQGVGKTFEAPGGGVKVLGGVSLRVERGEFVVVTGPSGSGKTTFLHLAGLLDRPTAGMIRFDGVDVSRLDETEICRIRKERVGMVFQNGSLLPHRSVRDNVIFRFRYMARRRKDAEERADRAIERVGLSSISSRAARLLSGGEMQRTAIARAIAVEPALLIADEPTGNLDEKTGGEIMDSLHTLNRNGMTILLVTHNTALLRYASRHLVCSGGQIEEIHAGN